MDLLTTVSIFFDNDIVLIGFLFLLLFITSVLFKKQKTKLKKVILATFIGVLFVIAAKEIITEDRICIIEQSKIACPDSYAFPSGHSTMVLIFAIILLGEPSFFIFLLFALFIMYSRLYLGVHTPLDILGAIPFAFVSCALSDLIFKRFLKEEDKNE
ncbi:MAG: phosphatase PAP2 family protein [Candidatus Micrarchaeia archaeon]|jgi:membrane-associated phospholipid phosphatase